MGNSFDYPGDYRIEISGWGLDNSFFVERTDLLWTTDDEKRVQLRRTLQEEAVVFVRLLSDEPSSGSLPVAYQVKSVAPMDRNGRCQIRLAQLHPRSKESLARESASKDSEGSRRVCNVQEFELELQHEEILQ
jgi:hypothetical protein